MIGWTSLAPWEFEFPFPGSLSTGHGAMAENQMNARFVEGCLEKGIQTRVWCLLFGVWGEDRLLVETDAGCLLLQKVYRATSLIRKAPPPRTLQ